MSTHCQLLNNLQEELLNDEVVKSREGLYFLADKSGEFLKNRKKSYLKKIIETHICFRQKLLQPVSHTKRPFLQKFYKVKWAAGEPSKALGICFAFKFFHDNEKFDFKHLSGIIRRHLPGINIEEEDAYFCRFPQEKILFCYAEIEKIRGKHLSLQEALNLKKILLNDLGDSIETSYSDLFMPANEEEIYKHIATLSNDVSSLSSLPHIMISFVKQSYDVLFFNVVLVRVIQLGIKPFEKIAQSFPLKMRIYINKTSLSIDSLIKEICVFSVEVPNAYFLRKNYSIDYLKVRRYLSLILEEHIGEFRDYNGGLLIKQYEQLDQIVESLPERIDNFSIIEELFFSFVPSNTQTLISPEVALDLHQLFYKIKELEYSSLYRMEYSESKASLIIFIKTDQEKVESLLYNIVLDESFLVAYAKKVVDNQTYFCFLQINPSDLSFLLRLQKALKELEKSFSKTVQDTLRIPLQESLPPTLHPHLLTDTNSATVCKALYDGLTRINLEEEPELAVAKSIEISPCKKRYLITLKSTRWSNGEYMLADHFIKAWKKAIMFHSKCLRPHLFYVIKNAEKISKGLLPIDSIGLKKQGNLEIFIELEYPAPYFTQLLANPIYSPLYNNDEDPQVFNGPFKLETHQKNKKISLVKNFLYWDERKVKLKKISLILVKEVSKIIEMFYKDELDWIGSPFSNLLQENKKHQLSFKTKEVPVPFWLHCNTTNPKLASAKIRKALSLAIDRSKIGTEILPNQVPSARVIPESLSLIDLPKTIYEENLKKAKQLFQEGLSKTKQEAKSFFLLLSYSTHTNFQGTLVHFLKQTWESAFGIKIILKEMEWDVYWNNLFNGEYELGGACQFPSYTDIYYFLESFLPVPINNSKWKNQHFQKWMNLAKEASSIDLQKEYLKKAEEILQDNMPVIPIFNRTHLYLCNPNLKNLIPSMLAYTDFKWAYFQKE